MAHEFWLYEEACSCGARTSRSPCHRSPESMRLFASGHRWAPFHPSCPPKHEIPDSPSHKLNLTTGKSGLILDLVIEAGNPADSDRFLPMLERHISAHGAAPRQAAADGGFASRKNLSRAKACVRDMAFQGVLSHPRYRERWLIPSPIDQNR